MSRRVLHVGAWGRNWGDHAIKFAMRRSLDVAFSARQLSADWEYADIQATDFDGFDFSPYDLVIVGGGGLLWDKPELKSYTGWQWRIPAEQLLEIEPPLVLYGLGWTRFPYHDPTGSEVMWSHLRIAASKAALVSVRNRETRDLLRQHGIGKVDHIPDPAIDLGPPVGSINIGCKLLGLCWASDKPEMRFGNQMRYDHWLECYAKYLKTVIDQTDYGIIMVEHIGGMDDAAHDIFKSYMGDRFISYQNYIGAARLADNGRPLTESVPEYFGVYDNCDAVFSSRKHGIWIPAGKSIPTLGFGFLNEVRWTLQSVGMGPFDISPVDLEVWPGIVGSALEHAVQEGPSVYERSLPPLRRALARFNKKVGALL